MRFEMDENYLDYILVPGGLMVLGVYHIWLIITIARYPARTVIWFNRVSRNRWVHHMMNDQKNNGTLAVQTLRNNLMASTLLATIAITLSSLISAVVSSTEKPITGYTIHQIKYFAVLVCFLVAFFCNMQCTRYYAHVSFLLNVPIPEEKDEYIEFVAQKLNKGGIFWSLGLRAFYFSFPLLLWIFGPIAMFACSCLMAIVLYFLDLVLSSTTYVPSFVTNGDKPNNNHDVESRSNSMRSTPYEETNLHSSLLGST